uniref:Endonuclease V n=1 Tax=Strigamia maritima TaxID=126957 RepID=T1IH10_STRMM
EFTPLMADVSTPIKKLYTFSILIPIKMANVNFHSFFTRMIRVFTAKLQSLLSMIEQIWLHAISRHFRNLFLKPPVDDVAPAILYSAKTTTKVPEKWVKMQEQIHKKVIETDIVEWQKSRVFSQNDNTINDKELKYVAGVDISYAKEGKTACAAIVVCEMPQMKVVYHHCQLKEITVPYIAGFLTFREVMPFLEVFRHLLIEVPRFKPQVILVDGNGLLHPRKAGLACHLGVLTGIPCVGVGKNYLRMENFDPDDFNGTDLPIIANDEKTIGMAVRTGSAMKPLFVSIGHKISLDTAVWLVKQCSKYRVPEPIRQADIRSREFLERHPDLKKSSRPNEP